MREGLNHYRFTSLWTVPGNVSRVFDVVSRLETYPSWWPEVKVINPIEGSTAEACIRALLPYSLRFHMSQEVADREAGILVARLTGDLDGYSRWTLRLLLMAAYLSSTRKWWSTRVCSGFWLRSLAPCSGSIMP